MRLTPGGLLDFWNGGANVLIFGGLQFVVGEIIWGLKFQISQMYYLWSEILGRRDYFGSDISCTSLSKPFSWYQVVFGNWTADYLEPLKKLV